MKYFPLFIQVEHKSIVVFGGGSEAAAKLRLVQKTDARLFVVAETIDSDVLELGQAIWVKSAPLAFELPSDLAFAYAATGDPALDARLAGKVRLEGGLACAVDQMDASDFSTPAIVDRDPVVVAIGTEGSAPVLARAIKADIESRLEPELGAVATAAASLRDVVNQVLVPGKPRRQFWQKFLSAARRTPQNAAQIGRNLLNKPVQLRPRVNLIELRADQPGLLTRDAHAALHDADVVVFSPDVPKGFTELARREALTLSDDPNAKAHIGAALRDGEHVVVVRTNGEWGDLAEAAIGFGVTAQFHLVQRPSALEALKPRLVAEAA